MKILINFILETLRGGSILKFLHENNSGDCEFIILTNPTT